MFDAMVVLTSFFHDSIWGSTKSSQWFGDSVDAALLHGSDLPGSPPDGVVTKMWISGGSKGLEYAGMFFLISYRFQHYFHSCCVVFFFVFSKTLDN